MTATAAMVVAGWGIVVPTTPVHAAADEINFTVDEDCTLAQAMHEALSTWRYIGFETDVSCGDQTGRGDRNTPFTITLARDVTLSEKLLEVATGPVTIDGRGHTIARASWAPPFRLFDVTDGGDLTITDAVLWGGRVVGDSGAAGADGDPGLLCTGEGDRAAGCPGESGGDGASAHGAAVQVTSSTLTLERVVVIDNTVVAGDGGVGGAGQDGADGTSASITAYNGGDGGDGGAGGSAFGAGVYATSSTVTISDSLFTGNTVTAGDGGRGGEAGAGGDGKPGTDAYCDTLGTAHSGDRGGNAGDGGDGGNGSLGGRAYGAAIYARYGDVRVERTSIVENTAHAGDGGVTGAGGAGGAATAGEDVGCAGVGAGGQSAKGGAGGVAGDSGLNGIVGAAGDALGAAVFFDGFSDSGPDGNANGSFTLAESTVAKTSAEPGGGAPNPNRYVDCPKYKVSDAPTTHNKQVCDAMYRDHGIGSAVAGDGALSVVASTITDNTTTLKLDADDFDDDWQLNAGIMQAWVSDTSIGSRGPESPEWHSGSWDQDWVPTVSVSVTSSILGPNHLETSDGDSLLPSDCREVVDQTGGGSQAGYKVRSMTVSSGGNNIVYAASASASAACMTGSGSDTYLTADAIGDTLGAYGSLLTSYTLPGGNASYGYAPSGKALGSGSACTDGATGDDAGLDQAGQAKPTSGCDAGAVERSSQIIVVDAHVWGTARYGDSEPVFRFRESDVPDGMTDGAVSCELSDVTWSPTLLPGTYDIDTSSCSGSLDGPAASHYQINVVGQDGFTQSKAFLSIKGSSPTIVYQDDVPLIEPVYSGFVNGETADELIDNGALTAPTACGTDYKQNDDAGTYSTSCTGAAADNYAIVSTDGTLTVTPLSIDVEISGKMTYGGTPEFFASPEYTSISFDASGLSCTKDTDGQSLSALHVASGGYTIDPATCTGLTTDETGNYAANRTSGPFTVLAARLSVTPDVDDIVYGLDASVSPAYDGFVEGEDASVLGRAPTCSTVYRAGDPVGSYPATCSGGAATDYALHYGSATFAVRAKSVNVTIRATETYGGTPVFFPHVSSDDAADREAFPTDAALSCTTVNGASMTGLHVSFYKMDSASCTGPASDADGNYVYTYHGGLLQVTPAPLTVTASDAQTTYGSAAPSIDPVYTGFVAGDDADDLSTPATCTPTDYSAGDGVGEYESTCAGAASDDYTVTYEPGTISVAPATLIVHPDDQTMTFNTPVPAISFGYDGFVSGDDASVIESPPTCVALDTVLAPVAPLSQPGVYPITCTGGKAADYVFGALAEPATLTVLDPDSFRLFASPATAFAGQHVEVYGGVLPDGTRVQFTLHSTPTAVGATTATADGTFGHSFAVPAGTDAGDHTIVATATLPDGTVLDQSAPLTVVASASGDGNGDAGDADDAGDAGGGAGGAGDGNGDVGATEGSADPSATGSDSADPYGILAITGGIADAAALSALGSLAVAIGAGLVVLVAVRRRRSRRS